MTKLYRCKWCKKKIESNNTPKSCPNCGTEQVRVVNYPKKRKKSMSTANKYTKTFREPIAFYEIGELK